MIFVANSNRQSSDSATEDRLNCSLGYAATSLAKSKPKKKLTGKAHQRNTDLDHFPK